MTRAIVVQTELRDASAAGAALGSEIAAAVGPGKQPDAVMLFASPSYSFAPLLASLTHACQPKVLVGCSSAGEFTNARNLNAAACGVALVSDEMVFSAGVAENVTADRRLSAQRLIGGFTGLASNAFEYRSVLVLSDVLAGYTEELLEQLTLITGGRYQIFGGGAGDDERFQRTHVFFGTRVLTNAAVALEILSKKPVGIGVSHGWHPAGAAMRVTEADGLRLVSLNAIPAAEIFAEHAELTGQAFDRENAVPFFLHNVLGIETGGGFKLRVPLGIDAKGAVLCAAEIPTGSLVRIMQTSHQSASGAASSAVRAAMGQLQGHAASGALFFDCAATRLRMGREFGLELDAVTEALRPAHYAGCNTYGQLARVTGQFSGFHNCTAVVCVFPE